MQELGWIKLYRQLRSNFLWPKGRKYTKLEAWLDMLLQANHAPERVLVDNQIINVDRGEFLTSEVQLARKWKWDRKTVRRFLHLLKCEKMATKKSTTKYTTVCLANYEFYQGEGTTERTTKRTPEGTSTPQQVPHKQELKNDKNKTYIVEIVKYLNKKCGKNFKPGTKATVQKIQARLNEGFTVEEFRRVIDIKASQWLKDPQWNKFLRPETLFGTKFESYLNEAPGQKSNYGTRRLEE